jgi:hypothetical protein
MVNTPFANLSGMGRNRNDLARQADAIDQLESISEEIGR